MITWGNLRQLFVATATHSFNTILVVTHHLQHVSTDYLTNSLAFYWATDHTEHSKHCSIRISLWDIAGEFRSYFQPVSREIIVNEVLQVFSILTLNIFCLWRIKWKNFRRPFLCDCTALKCAAVSFCWCVATVIWCGKRRWTSHGHAGSMTGAAGIICHVQHVPTGACHRQSSLCHFPTPPRPHHFPLEEENSLISPINTLTIDGAAPFPISTAVYSVFQVFISLLILFFEQP